MDFDVLASVITGQEAAVATPWVEYAVYGGIGLLLVGIIVRSLLRKPPEVAPKAPVDEDPAGSAGDAEEAARRAFNIHQIEVHDPASGNIRVRVAPQNEAPPPTGSAAPREKPRAAKAAPVVVPPKPGAQKATPQPAAPIEEAGRTLREGLARTHDGFVKRLGALFGGAKTIDDALLAELEETLFTADIGVRTSQHLVEQVYDSMKKRDLQDPAKVWAFLKARITEILQARSTPLDLDRTKPLVIMVVGVNGAGKTTTIGKLARKFSDQGRKVVLAAGDTFRAAAVEQLEVWSRRAGVPVIKGSEKQDPSSVIFEACKKARDEGYDIVIADTAGRLQAKKELMDELAKIHRVIGKAIPGAPHEVWLVLDATNGQNAISQAQVFREMVDVTGLVLTKLDGTAKGGVVIGITDEMKLPVRFIGIGEKVEDLRPFEPEAFVEALFADDASPRSTP